MFKRIKTSQHSLVFRFTYGLTALVWLAVLAVCFSAYEIQKSMGEHMIAQLAYDSHGVEALSEKFGRTLLTIAFFFMVLSYLCARLLAKWAVQPIQEVTTHLTEFSANLNHEVRTPLALIRTDAELGKREAATAQKAILRFERIMRSADEMAGSLEATYCLAQAEHGQAELTPLYDCVNDAFISAEAAAASRGLRLCNQVDVERVELLNRHMLLTVIRNIVRNAIDHAAPGTLDVRSTEHGLVFSDDGPGISPFEATQLFDRYYSTRRRDVSSGGGSSAPRLAEAGLGLAIAKRVCAVQGWGLEIAGTPENGKGLTLALSFALQNNPESNAGCRVFAGPSGIP